MPATQIELDHRHKSLDRVVNFRHRKQCFGVCHEAVEAVRRRCNGWGGSSTHFVMRSSMDLSSKMNVGRVIRDRSAPGRSWAMMCERTFLMSDSACLAIGWGKVTIVLFRLDDSLFLVIVAGLVGR